MAFEYDKEIIVKKYTTLKDYQNLQYCIWQRLPSLSLSCLSNTELQTEMYEEGSKQSLVD